MTYPSIHLTICTGTLVGLFAAPLSWAQTELIPFTGYRISGEFEDVSSGTRIDVDETRSRGFVFNVDDKPGSAYEFLYSKQSSQLLSSAPLPVTPLFDIDIEYIQMGGILLKPTGTQAHAFFGGAIGITHFSPGLSGFSSETQPSFSFTGGVKYSLNKHLGVRLDVRGYGTSVNSNTAIFCRNGACSLRFSGNLFTQFEGNVGLIIRF